MRKLLQNKWDQNAKFRIVLILIGALALHTLVLTLLVKNIRTAIETQILGKTDTSITTTTSTKTSPQSSPDISSDRAKASDTPSSSQAPAVKPGSSSGPATSSVPTPTIIPATGAYPSAPQCPDSGSNHDSSEFHTLWDLVRRCHYDHEHGQNPFTTEIANLFPGFNLRALLGNVEIGHTSPSGPMENTHKHGGFKWNVQLAHPQECAGFEGATYGVNGSAVQFHGFGDYGVEAEASVHSAVALLRQCNTADPTDYGYLFTVQHQSYGQIVIPYQGRVMPYPYYSVPIYNGGFGQYLTIDCIGYDPENPRRCRANIAEAQRFGAGSNWTSKTTGRGERPQGSSLFTLLWRVGDIYRSFDWSDQTYPYTFIWLCTLDNGLTYNPNGCRFNNTTTQVHEVAGTIPAAWDNLAGFDTEPEVGRITANGFTTRFGTRNTTCTAAGPDCHPIKMVRAFVGRYGSVLVFTPGKGTNIVPYLPERDVYFCNGQVCSYRDVGAIPSGWVGQNN